MTIADETTLKVEFNSTPVQPNLTDGTNLQSIIWVASYPKSGNTWIRVFIHNLLRELSGTTDAQDINRLHEHAGWEFGAKPFEAVIGKPLKEASHRELAEARPQAQRWLAQSRPGPFLAKTHLCVGREFDVPTINLDATLAAIYVVRNPLDVAISFAHHSGVSYDKIIANMAQPNYTTQNRERHVYEVLGSWSQHVAGWLGILSRPVLILRYEDMLADPARSFSKLANFLRLEPTENQLRSAIAKSSFSELKRQEGENGFREKPASAKEFFRDGRSGQWAEQLSPAQVQSIVRAHAPMMQRFGYLQPDCGASVSLARLATEL